MKISLRLLLFLLLGWLLPGIGQQQASATHILGGDLTYTSLGGNNYRVQFRFYRDCSGDAVGSWNLDYRNGSCSSLVQSVPLNIVGAVAIGNPYCPSIPQVCNKTSANPNYDLTTYEATVNLPPGQWQLSVRGANRSRPNIANLTNIAGMGFSCSGGSDNYMYLEATLDNRGTGVVNNSPRFDSQDFVVQYVCVNQSNTLTYSAIETDGDSLVYSLEAPLHDCGIPIPYANYTGGGNTGGTVTLRQNPLCTLTLPPAFAKFSPTLPLPVALDTLGTCPNRTARPAFYFNATARTITFTPNVYVANTAANCGRNKYQVVMKISEYRRVAGVRRLIGSVRREGVVIVENCLNRIPTPPTASNQTPNSGATPVNRPDTLAVNVYACSYARVRVNFPDPDATDRVTVTYPTDINTNSSYLNNGAIGTFSLSGQGTNRPVGTFVFQPSPSQIGKVVRINFRAEDNACPIKGVQNRVLVIRVLANSFARIAAPPTVATPQATVAPLNVCGGGVAQRLVGSIVRPDSVRTVAGQPISLQQYSYQWTVRGNGLDPAQASSASITVTPTVTSRYSLRITPLLGFTGCGPDTASVLIRVAPTGRNSFIVADSTGSLPVTQPGAPLAPPATYRFLNTSVPAAPTSGFQLDSIRWTYQRVKDASGAPVNDAAKVFSRRRQPDPIQLQAGGQYLIRLQSALTVIGSATAPQCPVADFQRLVNVAEITPVPNIITPNGDGQNETFLLPYTLRGGKLQIFNRWGRKVQEYGSYQNDWNATGQPAGLYYYLITDSQGTTSKGWIEVVK